MSRVRFITYHVRLFWPVLIGIVIFGLAQASLRLNDSLSVDEPFTANLVRLPLPQIFAALRYDGTMPLYYLLLKAWASIFGESEIALRSMSVLFFGATILTVGATARRAGGIEAGIVAGLLIATSSNMGLVHAATARQYALLCLEAALAVACCLALLRREHAANDEHHTRTLLPARVLWLLLLGMNVAGLLTHQLYVFVIGACVLAALCVSWRFFLVLAGWCAAAVLIYLALWWPVLRETLRLPTTSWMHPPQPIDFYYGIRALWDWNRGLLLLVYFVCVLLLRFRRISALFARKPYLFSLISLVVTLSAPYAVSSIKPVYNSSRTPVIFLPLVCVLAGIVIERLGVRIVTLGFVAALAAGSAQFAVTSALLPDPIPTRSTVQYLAASATCGDTLILGGLSLSEVEYYLRRFQIPDCVERLTFPLDTQGHPGWIDSAGLALRQQELAHEAQGIVARLARRPRATVWLFVGSGYGQEMTPLIADALDRQLTYRETLNLRGSFFESIRLYATEPSRTKDERGC